MPSWVCKLCILSCGLAGKGPLDWPDIADEESQRLHYERVHHIPVARDGEPPAQAMARFKRDNPTAGGPDCRCPGCAARRAALN